MKVKAPFEVHQIAVPVESGQANDNKMYVVPLRFCKQRFIGDVKSRIGNYYKHENGQFVGWWNYYRGVFSWMSAGVRIVKSVR